MIRAPSSTKSGRSGCRHHVGDGQMHDREVEGQVAGDLQKPTRDEPGIRRIADEGAWFIATMTTRHSVTAA